MTASGPTRTCVPADGADAGAVGDAAQALSTATATSTTMERRRVAIKDPPSGLPLLTLMRRRQASRNRLADGMAVGRQDIGRVELGTGGPAGPPWTVPEARVADPAPAP